MRSKAIGPVLAGLGAILLVVAAVLTWVVLPSQAQLPSDTDTTRTFEGTARVILNPQAVATGDLATAMIRNTPVNASRTVKVIATDGDAAEVSDSRTLTIAGQTLGSANATYAVDRKSLEATTDHPSDWAVIKHEGLTVSWPIGAERRDYTGWVNETKTTTPVRFLRQETHEGIETYVYESNAAPSPIKDEQTLATLPTALPVSALAALSAVLTIPDDMKAQLGAVLPTLTEPVPLSYTYESTSTYWVAPATGIVVDLSREEIRKAGLTLGLRVTPANIPIYDVTTKYTADSVTAAVNDARDGADKLALYGKTLPLIFLVVGILLLAGGIVLIVLSRRSTPTGPAY